MYWRAGGEGDREGSCMKRIYHPDAFEFVHQKNQCSRIRSEYAVYICKSSEIAGVR